MKKPHERPSIGVLLCATKDSEVVEYALVLANGKRLPIDSKWPSPELLDRLNEAAGAQDICTTGESSAPKESKTSGRDSYATGRG